MNDTKDKLLTERELFDKIFDKYHLSGRDTTDIVALIQFQKKAHADMVIGHDDRHYNGHMMINDPSTCMDCTNPDDRFARNELRKLQRERNK